MNILDVPEYRNDLVRYAGNKSINWRKLRGKSLLISGATGMIGKCLIDLLMYKNQQDDLDCRIIALGRNKEKAAARLGNYFNSGKFSFWEADINGNFDVPGEVDYIIHAASATHPLQYASDPVGTITANVFGTYNLLRLAERKKSERFLFLSSVEVYGENRGDIDKFTEDYLGYIDCNTLRAGYPESKRTGEALCQAFIQQGERDAVIVRLARVFGPTMLLNDSKASSQFIKNGVKGEDIVLKSEGTQKYSYLYVFDAVMGILLCLTGGENGAAYNVADDKFNITLRDFAEICARVGGKEVVFDLPSEEERRGFSKATKALMDGAKVRSLGFRVTRDTESAIRDTITILKQLD